MKQSFVFFKYLKNAPAIIIVALGLSLAFFIIRTDHWKDLYYEALNASPDTAYIPLPDTSEEKEAGELKIDTTETLVIDTVDIYQRGFNDGVEYATSVIITIPDSTEDVIPGEIIVNWEENLLNRGWVYYREASWIMSDSSILKVKFKSTYPIPPGKFEYSWHNRTYQQISKPIPVHNSQERIKFGIGILNLGFGLGIMQGDFSMDIGYDFSSELFIGGAKYWFNTGL